MGKLQIIIQVVVALVAVVFAVGRYNPYLFLKLPKYGWLLYAIGGNPMPPFFEERSLAPCWTKDNCPWLESGDVIVDACAKCGTNWMMTVVHEIRTWNQTDLKDFRDILDISPWIELKQFHEDVARDRYKTWGKDWNNTRLPFKQFKSHLPAWRRGSDGLKEMFVPVDSRPDVKFLVMVRDVMDTIYSFHHFTSKQSPAWMDYWGGLGLVQMSVTDLVKQMDDVFLQVNPFKFFESWWEYKDRKNVLMLHYETVFKDQRKYIKEIAEFVGMHGIPEEKIDEIVERVSVGFMKKRNDRYSHMAGPTRTLPMLQNDAIVRKGGVKQADLTSDEKQLIKQLELDILGQEKADLLKKGF